ncbi:MAG: DUF1295 domain-containing protein [Pirellulaceae bacterium]
MPEMILKPETFLLIVAGWTMLAILVFIWLFFITAPYGRFVRSGWGPMLDGSLNWLLMELPALLVFDAIFIWAGQLTTVSWVYFGFWNLHYGYRGLIYPWLIQRSQRVPLTITMSGASFNVINAGLQSLWLFVFAPARQVNWLLQPAFIVGAGLFLVGFLVHVHADHRLRQLRKELGPGYHIPTGGLFGWISCPNYFGEFVEWMGWALLTWSWSGVSFTIWTAANLFPRAIAIHRWYQERIAGYPRKRKAILPFLL